MVTINGKVFYNAPYMCGECEFYVGGGKLEGGKESMSGFCILFSKKKNFYGNLPKRCNGIFEKAMTFPDGTDLLITEK